MLEGQNSTTLVRNDATMIRLRPLDPQTGKQESEFVLPLHGGPFDWEPGRYQLISAPKDPFKVGVKSYYAASIPKTIHVKGDGGQPMISLRPKIKPPGSSQMMDVIQSEHDRWLEVPPDTRLYRAVKNAGPAQFAFLYVDKPEMVETSSTRRRSTASSAPPGSATSTRPASRGLSTGPSTNPRPGNRSRCLTATSRSPSRSSATSRSRTPSSPGCSVT